jgi:hypothetical protein
VRTHWIPSLTAVILMALPALAQDTQTYRLKGREDYQRPVNVELTVTNRGSGAFTVVRATRDRDGSIKSEMIGAGNLRGDILRLRLHDQRGATGSLLGQAVQGPILGIYKLLPNGQMRGLLYDSARRYGWRFTSERGQQITSVTPGPEAFYSPAGQLPFKRIVLCLDGIPYRVLKALHDKGHFKAFAAPGRLISVYPSLSSISWSSILGLPAEPGYQAVYYSNALNKQMGVTARKMKGSRFQSRMHHRHKGIIGHGLAYVAPFAMGKRQLKHLISELIDHKGSRTAFIYAYQTDPIAHMNGREKLERILKVVDEELGKLQAAFTKRYGEKLEIVIVSDHGHTLVSGKLVKLGKHLKKHGWKVEKKVRKPNHASFTTAGILSSISLHCQEASEPELARLVNLMDGVDLATYDVGGVKQFIVKRDGIARVDYDPARKAYAYTVVSGVDPLAYLPVYQALAAKGKVSADGYATSRDLFDATVAHEYPDAISRIRRGHTSLVRNPANVVVSLKTAYENGAGIVKFTARLRGRSGTHGALDQTNSAGIFLTNYRPTVPAIRTRDFAKYVNLNDYIQNGPPAEVTMAPTSERFSGPDPEYKDDLPREGMTLELNDKGAKVSAQAGVKTTIKLTVKRSRFLLRDKKMFSGTFDESVLKRDGQTWQVDLNRALPKLEEGKTYVIDILIERHDAAGKRVHKEERRIKIKYRGTYQVYD